MGNSIKELVNAFNLHNYFCDRVNTNFTVKGQKIVSSFADGTDVVEYLHRIGKGIIEQQYLGREVVAGRYYNLNYFPFVLNGKEEKRSGNVKEVKLADSTSREIIRNLKMHFANEFDRAVTLKVIALLEKEVGITKEEGHKWVRRTIQEGAMNESNPLRKHYLYCIAFDGKYLEEQYDSEAFEWFKAAYIQEFNSRLRDCDLKSSDFYDYKDGMLYIKNVSDKVVKNVAEYVKKEAAFDFRTLGQEDSKVENLKDVLGSLIFEWTGKSIDAYECIEFGIRNNFAIIPLTRRYDGQLESLKYKDRYLINTKYKSLVEDIKGKVADQDVDNCESSVYALSNDRIAKLLPEIMRSPIAYNKKTGHFEFAANLGPNSKVDLESPRPDSVPFSVLQETSLDVPGVANAKCGSSISIVSKDSAYYSTQDLSQPGAGVASGGIGSQEQTFSDSDSESNSRLSRSESTLSSDSTAARKHVTRFRERESRRSTTPVDFSPS